MKQKINLSIGIIIVIFLAILVITKLFTLTDLPLHTIGVLFGAVITALITYFLLLGQSQAEEIKERNVRVFEAKSKRFNIFINKLWAIWDDRVVSLEELNEIIKLVSKDIVLYTNPATVDKILINLIAIAEQAKPDKSNNKDAESTKIIQKNIFDIINELAKEMGLGGEIQPGIREKLNTLEEKVVPFLIQKDFINSFTKDLKSTFDNSEDGLNITDVEYRDKFFWCQINKSNVYFIAGPMEREKTKGAFIGVYVEFWGNRNFTKYRDASRGWRKDYLRGMRANCGAEEIMNFSDFERVEKEFYKINQGEEENSHKNQLALRMIRLYKEWRIDGKNVDEIIDECTK